MREFNELVGQVLGSDDPVEQGSLYVGQSVYGDVPLFIRLSDFFLSGRILGSAGSGKTVFGTRLITQLSAMQADARVRRMRERGRAVPEYSIVCIDQKGDSALFNNNLLAAWLAGARFGPLDLRAGEQSLVYNPLAQSHHGSMSGQQTVQEVANALGLYYGQGWSKGYFGAWNLATLAVLFNAIRAAGRAGAAAAAGSAGGPAGRPLDSFRALSRVLENEREFLAVGGKQKHLEEGAAVAITLSQLGNIHALNETAASLAGRPAAWAARLDAASLFQRKQYIHGTLPFGQEPSVGPLITNLLNYQIFNAAQFAKDRRYRVIVFQDEAQHALSRQLVQLFEQARGFGVTYVLMHQHRGQLARINDEDLNPHVDTNTAWTVYFDAGTEDMIRHIQELSAEVRVANPSWSVPMTEFGPSLNEADYSFMKAVQAAEKVGFGERTAPAYSREEILRLNSQGNVGWLRLRVQRGHTRLCGIVPFYWKHHIPEASYRKLESRPRPGPSASTITVLAEPFTEAPKPVVIAPPILKKPE